MTEWRPVASHVERQRPERLRLHVWRGLVTLCGLDAEPGPRTETGRECRKCAEWLAWKAAT